MTDSSGQETDIILLLDIRGRVQGVGFRDFVQREADTLGLDGWVRNRRDGSVEAVVRGEKKLVERLLGRCHEGPAASRVDAVKIYGTERSALDLRPAGEKFAVLPTE